ncbi:SDR family NAD(P)-dependent oxidoreductase [Streptomyces sp. Inha503]|uniref:SDR family NAD(P)-dependent oxidoreductase n=1 Tax=Streptomyces sp. Inha503 TaxID=3383314 RepID=UPI00399FE5DD
MDLQLTGKRVLVTGASRGIGLAIVRAFQQEGALVTATARRSTPELDATGATFIPVDLATADGPQRLVDAVLAVDPRIDVLVNNAGGGEMPQEAFGDPLNGGDEVWAYGFALNFESAVRTTRAALPSLLEARGAVVNISSDSARRPGTEPLPYSVAKAALNAFTRQLAERMAPSGVRINAVSPSVTRTPQITSEDGYVARVADNVGVDHETLMAALPKETGMLTETLIDPAEIARAVLLLASPTMPNAIGVNLSVDAGSTKIV